MAQPWVADLHIHSRYSRACSRDLDLDNLAWWAQRKGITLLGSGDITHPGWLEHCREGLVAAEPGLFQLAPDRQAQVARRLPAGLRAPVRFLLSGEIATIYKRGERTRKVHHLVYLPSFEAADRLRAALGPGGRGGNLGSDGRPILGLDSRDLLEVTLESGGFLVPAHIWTPWFSVLGSRSGFDSVAECYGDLADHIHAVETGLSSDPPMNWRVSGLDRYHLVSNSDAHSLPALAREATRLATPLDYAAIAAALATGDGLAGTIEFFPEEGKYHADGHRACGIGWDPARTRAAGGLCPRCGKPLTVGVLHRVEELADRPAGFVPPGAPGVSYLIQLHEILGEVHGVGARARTVVERVDALTAALGSELAILLDVPVPEVARVGGELLAEAVTRLRAGRVRRVAGFDGQFGQIRLFDEGELAAGDTLFDLGAARRKAAPAPRPRPARPRSRREVAPPIAAPPSMHRPIEPMLAGLEEVGTGILDRLDALQRVAASAPAGPLLVVAGPGTGKTRTLTHRIAYLCADLNVRPEECLAITFTRRAAQELRERLGGLLASEADHVTVATFHALSLSILRDHPAAAGLRPGFVVGVAGAPGAHVALEELTTRAAALLREHPDLAAAYRARWRWVFVDEYQDVDADDHELLRLLVDGNICAIGDPDQAIYSFRGADVGYFQRFTSDFTGARAVRLARNYRSTAPIIAAASQVIAPTSLVPGRRLEPAKLDPDAPVVGLHAAASVPAEAEWVARTIDALVGGVSHRSFDGGGVDSRAQPGEPLAFSDIAVLYRTDAQAAPVVEALTRAGLPLQKRSHDRLAARRAVVALARELRFVSGPSLADRLNLAARNLTQGGLRLVEADGALPALLPDAEVFAGLELLLALARRCASDEELLGAVATGAETDALDPGSQAVQLLTLHAAKGLEWPVVFIVGCEDGLLPLRRPDSDPAEERRLLFVGMTRARRRLFLSHTTRRPRTPFLDPVDRGLLERLTLGEVEAPAPRHRQLRLL